MKLLQLIFFAFSMQAIAGADTWRLPEPTARVSPSGRYVLRILPGDGREKKAVAVIFELTSDGDHYAKKKEFSLLNALAPVETCISDSAEIYTFDDWARMGQKHVIVWYSAEGMLKAEYTLAQLFPAQALAEIRDKHSSVSSVQWRNGVSRFDGKWVIIPTSLGGNLGLSEGTIAYDPPPSEKK